MSPIVERFMSSPLFYLDPSTFLDGVVFIYAGAPKSTGPQVLTVIKLFEMMFLEFTESNCPTVFNYVKC